MNNDDLELDIALGLEEAYHAWRPIARERDYRWADEQDQISDHFKYLEHEAYLDDMDSGADLSTYRAYLQSRVWKVRAARAKRWGFCQRCGAESPTLDAHHLTYERLGAERPSDLIALCRRCHQQEHGR